MNVSSGPSAELPLPIPSPEQGSSSVESPSELEKKAFPADTASQGPATMMPAVDPSQFAVTTQADPITTTDDQTSDNNADDADVIEKEWVTKAKAIVNNTRNNPNQQSDELGKFKADYIKKRFNKEVKMPKGASPSS